MIESLEWVLSVVPRVYRLSDMLFWTSSTK